MNCLGSCAESGKNCSAASSTFLMPNLASLLVANCNQLFPDCILIFPWPDTELGVTMTLKSGVEQQGQTILNFHFLIATLMIGTLYQTPSCLLPALLKFHHLIIFVNSHILLFLSDFRFSCFVLFFFNLISK